MIKIKKVLNGPKCVLKVYGKKRLFSIGKKFSFNVNIPFFEKLYEKLKMVQSESKSTWKVKRKVLIKEPLVLNDH